MALDPAQALELQMLAHTQLIREAEERGDSQIRRMYGEAVVFITGGTGFLGKQLIEKLFRSCREIKKIYLLSRCKKGKSMQERLTELLRDPVYDEVRKVYPDFEDRIFQIEGDINQLRLGLKPADWNTLTEEVNFIFHGAATVRFDEPLKSAILTNVRGTREMIQLARECRYLRAMVYLSTAYAHCNRSELREQFYDSPVAPTAIVELVETIEESKLNAIEAKLIEDWPNTYTFSKAVAEEMIRTTAQGLPICIVRPAIVTPAHREPMPGWLDISNCNGPSGVIIGTGLGIVRTIWVDLRMAVDLVPVDFVNNLAITASWDTANRHESGKKEIRIYTLSRSRNKVLWAQMQNFLETDARNLASPKSIWYGYSLATSNKYLHIIQCLFLHYIPALLMDSILMVLGNKIRMRRIYKKVFKINQMLSYFIFHSWIQHDENTLSLLPLMSKTDRGIFSFDMANVDFHEFMSIWCLGLRKYIVKDGLQDTEYGMKKQSVFKILNVIVLILYAILIWKVLCLSFNTLSFCSLI